MAAFWDAFEAFGKYKIGVVQCFLVNIFIFSIGVIAWSTVYWGFLPSINEKLNLTIALESSKAFQKDLEEDFEEAKKQKSTLFSLNSRQRTEIENLNSQLKVKDESLNYLKNQLKVTQSMLRISQIQLDKINGMIDKLKAKNYQLEKEREEYGKELEKRAMDVQILLTELNQMKMKFSNYSQIYFQMNQTALHSVYEPVLETEWTENDESKRNVTS